MNTVAGLTGIGLVTFVLFASSVALRPQPVEQAPVAARQDAVMFGLGAGQTFDRGFYSRAGPKRHLAELKKKAGPVAKGD